MKNHHGKIIEEQIYKSGHKKQEVAKRLGITRQTLSNKFKTPNLPLDFMLKIGALIAYDFSNDIPELKKVKPYPVDEDTPSVNRILEQEDDILWKDKYISLLESYNRFMQNRQDSNMLLATAINDLCRELRGLVMEKKK